jgi:transcriptional regulator with XRE-family HTH domain
MSEAAYIGRNLKAARVRRLLTQEELAKKAGVSPSTTSTSSAIRRCRTSARSGSWRRLWTWTQPRF